MFGCWVLGGIKPHASSSEPMGWGPRTETQTLPVQPCLSPPKPELAQAAGNRPPWEMVSTSLLEEGPTSKWVLLLGVPVMGFLTKGAPPCPQGPTHHHSVQSGHHLLGFAPGRVPFQRQQSQGRAGLAWALAFGSGSPFLSCCSPSLPLLGGARGSLQNPEFGTKLSQFPWL